MMTSISISSRFVVRAGIISALIIGLALLAVLLMADSNSEPGGLGGGGEPPEELESIFNEIQIPAGFVVDEPPVGTGSDLRASFWINGGAQAALDVFATRLAAQAWVSEEAIGNAVTSQKDDGSKLEGLVQEFYRDQYRITVTIVATDKDPARGDAQMHILLEKVPPEEIPGR